MTISPFFLQLRSAYQAEMDDLTFDSEGKGVLRQRLVEKRQELGFLIKMIEISPEMVAVIFHQGLRVVRPAVLEHLISLDADELPEWDALSDAVALTPWAQELADVILTEPMGAWFMTITAALEYMYGKPGAAQADRGDEDEDEDQDGEERDEDAFDEDARARDEAGADWMVEQGFDRKD